jgi:hypothetical protein
MKNVISLENGVAAELSQLQLSMLAKSVQLMSVVIEENSLTDEQKTALEQLRALFDTVDF